MPANEIDMAITFRFWVDFSSFSSNTGSQVVFNNYTHLKKNQREQDVDEENIHQTIKAFIIKKKVFFGWINLIFIQKVDLENMIVFCDI